MLVPPQLRALISSARSVADHALDPLLDLTAAAYVPPKPQPAPLDYVGIIHDTSTGQIEQITKPNTLQMLSELRHKLITDTDGHRSMTIVRKEVGAQVRPGMLTRSILDIMEANQARAHWIMLHGPD
jgi:hypothetical protein